MEVASGVENLLSKLGKSEQWKGAIGEHLSYVLQEHKENKMVCSLLFQWRGQQSAKHKYITEHNYVMFGFVMIELCYILVELFLGYIHFHCCMYCCKMLN